MSLSIQDIIAKVTGLSGEIESLKTQVTQLTQAQADLATAKASIASAETITKDLQVQIVTLTTKNAEQQDAITKATSENARLTKELNDTKASVAAEAAKIAASNLAAIGVQAPIADNIKPIEPKKVKEEQPAFGLSRFLDGACAEIEKLYPRTNSN